MCAALERRNRRDLFNVYQILKPNFFDNQIKEGFLYSLLSGKSSLSSTLYVLPEDRKPQHSSERFEGMIDFPFTENVYQATFELLINVVKSSLTKKNKKLWL